MISSTNEKTLDWTQQRSLRRFPENNNSSYSNNNTAKLEKLQHHSWSTRDNEQSDRNMHSLLSSSLMNSSRTRTSDSESYTNNVFQSRVHSSSPTDVAEEHLGFIHALGLRASQGKTLSRAMKSSETKEIKETKEVKENKEFKETKDFKETELESSVITEPKPNKDTFVRSVLQNGEYLCQYESWHEFIGPEETKKCSQKVIQRNENIWELVAVEYNYLRLLALIQELYCNSYPYLEAGTALSAVTRTSSASRPESTESVRSNSITEIKEKSNNLFESFDSLIPGLDKLIDYHAQICNHLLNNHIIRPDRVITEAGRVLLESIPEDFIPVLSELYGRINYIKPYVNQKLTSFKKYPMFLSYYHKCERDPRSNKKNIEDALLRISVNWSKKVSTLNSLLGNTVNDSQDLNNLLKFKEKIDNIINGASHVMDNAINNKLLLNFVENYEICAEVEDSEKVYKMMSAHNAKLIFNGKLKFELKKSSNGKLLSREVHGVALEGCIFFLQAILEPGKETYKYQLFKERDSAFPALLEWGKLYGYFREEHSKKSEAYSFYVIIEKPGPSIKRLFVDNPTDRNTWKKCMMQGFARWQSETSDIKEADSQLNEELQRIEKKWINTQFGIDLIKNMDSSLKAQLEYRTVGFRCILEKQLERLYAANSLVKRNSSNSIATVTENEVKDDLDSSKHICTDNFLPDLSTREGIHDWLEMFMEWVFKIYRLYVNRLKFSLCSSGANITRSASEIEARKRPSIPTVKKCDTFSSRDSPSNEKRQTEVTFLNPPITKQKKDQRRISVSGISNLFRISSKNFKGNEADKSQDHTSIKDVIHEIENDAATVSNIEIVSETDFFLSGLSKDTVTAFNEINLAAKNITVEMLNLRTQNIVLEAEMKKIQEENQSFREFLLKYQKSAGEGHSGMLMGNNSQPKSDSANNPGGSSGLNTTGSTNFIAEGLEAMNENSSVFMHNNQKMVESSRQLENLREKYEKFAEEKKKWDKEYKTQRLTIENDREKIFQKKSELQNEKDNLIEREKKYNANCISLQKKMDMYAETYGVTLDEEQMQHHTEGLLLSNVKLQQMLQMQPHFRSHSDDVSHKRSSKSSLSMPVSPPLASTEATSYNCDQAGTSDPCQASTIPDQLRGSLINQERQTLKTNSSDNILETRSKVTSTSMPKTKMTPSIDRKEMYSSSNMCFTGDDKEERDCSSDVDDFHSPPNTNIRNSTFGITQTRKSITSIISKTISISDNAKPIVQNSTVNSTTSFDSISTNKSQGLGIPIALAAKSKFKKDKTKKFKI